MKTSSGSISVKNLSFEVGSFFSEFAKLIGELLLSLDGLCLCFLSACGGFFVVLKFSNAIFESVILHLATKNTNCFFW